MQVFGDCQRVPDLQAVMGKPWHQEGRRQQEKFCPRGRVVRTDMLLFKVDAGHFAEQPSAQRPRAVIFAGDGEDGFGHIRQIS
jgi:hypothetical protein